MTEHSEDTAPLPEGLLRQFLEETKIQAPEVKDVELPPNVVIFDPKAAAKIKKEKAKEVLKTLSSKSDSKRVPCGRILADRSSIPIPSFPAKH